MAECTVDGCHTKAVKRSWCHTHYTRWHRHGDPTIRKIEDHGLSKTPEYAIWRSMKDRCTKPNHEWYSYYGGRGIRVCDRWLNSFIAFIGDMGNKPKGYSIERINNDGNYEPNNCKWASSSEQAKNRRLTRDSLGRWESLELIGKRG